MQTRIRTNLAHLAVCLSVAFTASCGTDDKPHCARGEVSCDGRCVDLSNDPSYCGACGTRCAEGEVCDIGRCSAECDSGTADCEGRCHDLDTDPANCGGCGLSCADEQLCSGGECADACSGGLTACDEVCRDLRTDPLHCGDCERTCTPEQVCADGLCATACAGTFTNCGGACRDLQSDADHCGGCGLACPETQVCNVGACADACDPGLTACSGDCIDTLSDARHCGGCGAACPIGEGCSNGQCGDSDDAPTFTSTPVTAIDEDAAYTYAVTVSDLDAGDMLQLAATTAPAWLTFTDNGDRTGTLSGTPAQSDVGTHSVVLVVSDGTTQVEQSFDIVVTAVDDPPVFTSTPVTTGADDRPYVYTVAVSDEENETVVLVATTLPAWLTLTDNGDGTYSLAGTPSDAEIGDHAVVLEATAGALTATQSFTIVVSDLNDPPMITSTAVLAGTEDALYTYEITATDTDAGDMLAFSIAGLPAWLTLTDHFDGTATLSGTPSNDEVGDTMIALVVTDGTTPVTQSFTITVANTNDAPLFSSTEVTAATEDALYTYAITTLDVDMGDTVEITSGTLPGWLTLTDGGDGAATLSGTPADADVANVTIDLTVTDVAGASATQSFTIVVTPVNDPPSFVSAGVVDATEDDDYTYTITTTDEEAAPLTILAPTLPSWLSFTDNGDRTASLTGTPLNANVGTHTVTLSVSDGVNTPVEQTFTITVVNVNDAPTFTSTEITTATEDVAYTYAITTEDVDVGSTMTISAETLPGWLTFTVTGAGTASLTGTPTNAEVGTHDVTLEVTDGTATTQQSFTITVANANDAPTFTSTPVLAATEDSAYAYSITTADDDTVSTRTITATVLPAWLTLTPTGNGTATLTGTPLNAHVGTHDVTLSVSDGTDSATQSFTITVTNTNDAPTFTSVPVTSALEDAPYAYAITTSDIDVGDSVSIIGTVLPGWLTVLDNGNGTASLTGTPLNTDVGSHAVTLTVDDGDSTTTQTFTITVTNTNDAPTFSSAPVVNATEDSVYTYAVTTSDVDVISTRTVTATVLPAWLTLTPTGNGTATLSGTPLNAHVGTHNVTLSVSDGIASTTQSFTITVANTNDAPAFSSTPITAVNANSPYAYAITTTDVDVSDTRVITSSTLPAWLSLVPTGNGTATLSGTPAPSDAGSVMVTLTVTDAANATATQTFTLVVTTQPPVAANKMYAVIGNTELLVESVASKAAVARGNVFLGSTDDLIVGASDPDTALSSLTATLVTGPSSGSLVLSADGSFSYAPNALFIGTDSFTYRLSDGFNNSNVATATLVVASRVWYVNNLTNVDNAGAKNPLGGNGTSIDAFDTLASFELASSAAGDIVYVSVGDSAYDSGDADGLDLLNSQRIVGAAATLTVGIVPLVLGVPANRPTILGTVGNAITLASSNVLEGLAVGCTGTRDCVRGNGASAGTLSDVAIMSTGTGAGVHLSSHSGTFTMGSSLINGGGAGLLLDGATSPSIQLTNTAVSGSTLGISVNGSTATTMITGGSVTMSGGRAIAINAAASGGSLTLTGGATLAATSVASGNAISVTGNNFGFNLALGAVTLTGSPGAADAVSISNLGVGSTVSFNGATTISGFPAHGIVLTGTTITSNQATYTFADLQTSTLAGTDFRIVGGRPNVTAHLRAGTGIDNAAGASVSVTGTSNANVLFDGGAITDTTTSTASLDLSNNSGSSIRFDSNVKVTPAMSTVGVNATQAAASGTSVRFGQLDVTTNGAVGMDASNLALLNIGGGALSTTGARVLSLATIGSGTLALTSTSVTNATGTGGVVVTGFTGTVGLGVLTANVTGGTALQAQTVTALSTTAGTVAATNGKALDLDTLAATISLSNVTGSGSATEGIRLNALTGNVTVTAGAISGSTGTEIALAGGSANVTLGTSIANVSGKALTISSGTGGNVTLSGNIQCDGTGVTINNNSGTGTISLSGALDVDTGTGTAFDITGNTRSVSLAGTIDVQNTSGAGLNVTGSIFSAPNTANIILTTTGVPVTITNSTITPATVRFRSITANGAPSGIVLSNVTSAGFFVDGTGSAGTGGTLQNITGSAIVLNSVGNVHLSSMNINNVGGRGIESTTGAVDDLDLTQMSFSSCGNAVNEGAVYITTNLTGTCDFTNSTFTTSSDNNVEIVASTGTLNLNITGSTFSNAPAPLGNAGLIVETRNASTANVKVTASTFTNNGSTHAYFGALDSSTLNVRVTGSGFTAPVVATPLGLRFAQGESADIAFDVSQNTFSGNAASLTDSTNITAIEVVTASSSTFTGSVNGIIANQIAFSNQNFGVAMDFRGDATHTLRIANNAFGITRTGFIGYIAGELTGSSAGNVTVTNNSGTIASPSALWGLNETTMASTTLCTDITGNAFAMPGGIFGIDLRQSASSTVSLQRGASASNVPTTVLTNNNPSATNLVTGTVTVVSNGTCLVPVVPAF